jgi:hypothetical protein
VTAEVGDSDKFAPMSKVATADTDRIEYLVLRRFPGALSLKLPTSLNSGTRYMPNRAQLRADVDGYTAELRLLAATELAALYAAERDKEAAERLAKAEADERALFFHQPYANADYEHWSRAAHWSLDEAIALSFGKAPEVVNWPKIQGLVIVSPFAAKYARRRDLALRAVPWKQLFDPVLPSIFVAWCKKTDLSFPAELEEALTKRGKLIDWQAKYDELIAFIDKQEKDWSEMCSSQGNDWKGLVAGRDDYIATLEAQIQQMRSEQSHATKVSEDKPLAVKERDSLLRLVIGMAVGGYGYDPTQKRSEQPAAIADDLLRLGVGLDVDTVRKWLKAGSDLLPSDSRATG